MSTLSASNPARSERSRSRRPCFHFSCRRTPARSSRVSVRTRHSGRTSASRRERTKQRLFFILAMGLAFVAVVCAFWMLLAVRQSSRGNDVSFYLGLAMPAISLVVAAITVRRTLDRGRRLHRSRVLDFADTQFPADHR